jgi:hypothetical protein
MRSSDGDGGLLDLLYHILTDAGSRQVREQVIYVIKRRSLSRNRPEHLQG